MIADPLIPWLEEKGLQVTRHYFRSTSIQLGYAIHWRNLYLAWRTDEENQKVWILLVKRVGEVEGLANPFLALYLLATAAREVLGDDYHLYGNVDVMCNSSLSKERLGHFYQRWTGAKKSEDGWFSLAVSEVYALRDIRKRQKPGHV